MYEFTLTHFIPDFYSSKMTKKLGSDISSKIVYLGDTTKK